ncbi:MAG: pyruvate kinase [Acidobacteriota bacterium]
MGINPASLALKRRRTKIVATLGPASTDPRVIDDLIAAGVNVVRLNMSHGDHDSHRMRFDRVRAAAERRGATVAILADLCGPKIRVGKLEGGAVTLVAGAPVTVTTRPVVGTAAFLPSEYAGLPRDVKTGDRILLDDGNLELRVDSVEDPDVGCTVVHGGILKDHKGMNLPGVAVSAPCLTAKDRDDARFALELGVDFLALSFVKEAQDVRTLRDLVSASGKNAGIIAKIERREALESIEAIIDASDGIMIARGDLGVELPPEEVPVTQDQLIDMARGHDRPVIVATQMLESMVEHPRPTRAEVMDVSHAVSAGADAVMLSAETAAGAFPVEAVRMMDRIARQTEGYLWGHGYFASLTEDDEDPRPMPIGDAMARSIALLSRDLWVRAIVIVAQSVTSATNVSASRPAAPVLAVSPDEGACRRMSLLWGVEPVRAETASLEASPDLARRLTKDLGLAADGQYILVVRGFSSDPARNAPSITALAV